MSSGMKACLFCLFIFACLYVGLLVNWKAEKRFVTQCDRYGAIILNDTIYVCTRVKEVDRKEVANDLF